ncbi:MAG: hypothetical protein RL595_1998, partial [Planctomycetota bacterium]
RKGQMPTGRSGMYSSDCPVLMVKNKLAGSKYRFLEIRGFFVETVFVTILVLEDLDILEVGALVILLTDLTAG